MRIEKLTDKLELIHLDRPVDYERLIQSSWYLDDEEGLRDVEMFHGRRAACEVEDLF